MILFSTGGGFPNICFSGLSPQTRRKSIDQSSQDCTGYNLHGEYMKAAATRDELAFMCNIPDHLTSTKIGTEYWKLAVRLLSPEPKRLHSLAQKSFRTRN
jgi:hypothetical protein